jgi:hypothetical protein
MCFQNTEIFLVQTEQLLDVQKGQEFMKAFAELLKTNVNLRKYFKNLIQFDCSFNKSMQLIVSCFFLCLFTNIYEAKLLTGVLLNL